MYFSPRSSVRVLGSYSAEFPVGVRQGSEPAALGNFCMLMTLLLRQILWKNWLASYLCVNMKKTKIMHSKYGSNQRLKSGKWPCGVCRKGVCKNSIFCISGKHWIHKRCSGSKGSLKHDDTFVVFELQKPCPSYLSYLSRSPHSATLVMLLETLVAVLMPSQPGRNLPVKSSENSWSSLRTGASLSDLVGVYSLLVFVECFFMPVRPGL